jgi:type VI secretion system protein ImpF
MPPVEQRTSILPTVLDRLLDDTPDQPERDRVIYFNLDSYKAALARDLEALLNSRVIRFEQFTELYPLADKSMVNYGIPDMCSLSLLKPDDRALLQKHVHHAITNYEPRLARVAVTLDATENIERYLRFRVDALLIIHPFHPPISFDATLQLSSNLYQVKEQR